MAIAELQANPKDILIFLAFCYAGLVAYAMLFGFVKITVSDALLRRRIAKDKYLCNDFAPVVEPDCVVHLVHGTWAQTSKWHCQGSSFIENLERDLGLIGRPPKIQYVRFLWGGGNALKDRSDAIGRFLKHLLWNQSDFPNIPHFVICHSHAGNVVVRTLMDAPESIRRQIAGVFCVATPFLLSLPGVFLSEYWISKGLMQISRALSIIAATCLVAFLLIPILVGANDEKALIWSALAWIFFATVLLMIGIRTSRLMVETTIPAEGVPAKLFEKLVIIRAAGDEAAAALGAAFILRFAILASWGTLLRTINRKVDFGESKLIVSRWIYVGIVVAGISLWLGFSSDSPIFGSNLSELSIDRIKLAVLVLNAVVGLYFLYIVVCLLASLFAEGVRLGVELATCLLYLPVDFLSGLLLLPFAPELVLATTRSGLSAEASVPCAEGARSGAFYQLSYEGRQLLNHSAYDHVDTSSIVASELMRRWSESHSR